MDLKEPEKIEILKMKYLDHAEDLRFRTMYDFKLLSGFITLNIGLAAWLSKFPLSNVLYKIGFAFFVFGLSVAAVMLLSKNLRRRKVIVDIFANLNQAFQFDSDGSYIKGRSINPTPNKITTYWFNWYLCIIILFLFAQFFIIFGSPIKSDEKKNTIQSIELKSKDALDLNVHIDRRPNNANSCAKVNPRPWDSI